MNDYDIKMEFIGLPKHPNLPKRGVRLTHVPTGIIEECTDEISSIRNYAKAIKRLERKVEDKNEQN